jgi:hypothetical protein
MTTESEVAAFAILNQDQKEIIDAMELRMHFLEAFCLDWSWTSL